MNPTLLSIIKAIAYPLLDLSDGLRQFRILIPLAGLLDILVDFLLNTIERNYPVFQEELAKVINEAMADQGEKVENIREWLNEVLKD